MNIPRTVLFMAMAAVSLSVSAEMDPAEIQALRTYCKADVERLCANVQPGGGRIKECLMAQKDSMSVGCAKALKELKDAKKK